MDYDHPIITQNAQETAALGEKFAQYLVGGEAPRVFCLYGNLGSGKTTFTQGLARGLGITSRLLSPTFIIVRRYELQQNKALYHMDLYRLNSMDEMEELGLPEIFDDPHAYVVIEWAEKLAENLPGSRLDIWFKVLDDGKHEITVKQGS